MKQRKDVTDIVYSLHKHIKAEIRTLDKENEILLNQGRKHFQKVLSEKILKKPQSKNVVARVRLKSYLAVTKVKTFISGFFNSNTLRGKLFYSLKKRAKSIADFIFNVFKRKKENLENK